MRNFTEAETTRKSKKNFDEFTEMLLENVEYRIRDQKKLCWKYMRRRIQHFALST